MPDSKDKRSKWGLSGILHKDRPTSTGAAPDSTYGSEASRDSYTGAPSLTGSDNSHNYVNDQGQVVTTTTTTTTTTTAGGGNATTSGPHESNLANKLDPRVDSSADQQTEVQETVQHHPPGIPPKSTMRERSPNPQPIPSRQAPPIQPSMRSQGDRVPNYDSPSSPTGRHNFSYPSRTPPNGPTAGGGQQSTLQGLKTAAVGIHVSPIPPPLPAALRGTTLEPQPTNKKYQGAGETLRGTLSGAVDKRFNAPPEQLAAHSQVANSGRSEIESGRLSDQSRQSGGIGTPQAVKGILRKRAGSGGLRVVNE